jgi:hypothetical protein
MTELTPTAESRLNAYLNELRRVLSGSPTVDPADVERDVRDHIDAALVGEAQPVGDSALNKVLQTLGSPSQWLSESSRPARGPVLSLTVIRGSIAAFCGRLAGGPESYRLAYLSFLVFVAGCTLAFLAERPGPLVIAMPVSFIFARAALSLFTPERLSGGQKWLLYPVLAITYVGILGAILIYPIGFGTYRARYSDLTGAQIAADFSGCIGAAFFLLGLVSTLFPAAVRNVFHPFTARFSRRTGLKLASAGLIVLLAAVGATIAGRPRIRPDASAAGPTPTVGKPLH